ncbi:efflux RND transporter periplasmic adaptor subunit [Shewanella sp. JM162201]|uniref:Efflux RND transporter periplasmic adaptor subunit n=1 Tax=Shewanella jiangmenensis TaxID=2837387 RepID=A0ABS5UZD5_9GAMM|nr:efflux RND transporter periplasmic adaptor subunit [Shewanella jiangmenensis]MBT1443557.1 efflux RND transporter periplasmic adaptor subunit [Shewanella jiangmenensis]
MSTIVRRSLPFIILVLFLIAAVALMATREAPEQKAEEAALPLIEVMQVQQETLSLNLPSYGVVNPKHKTQLVAEVQGRLLSVSANFVAGGVVKKGDELAVIEPSDYQADLMQAEASLAQATAALNEEIARGEVAKTEFKGYDKGVPPELGLRIPQLKKEQANVKFAEAALERAKRNLARTVIRAPFDGIVKGRNVDLGQYVTMGTKLGDLYDTGIAEIRLPLANADLAYLESVEKPDTEVTLTASLAGREVSWKGDIVRSEGMIDEGNRMVYLVAEVKDPYLRNNKAQGELPLKFGTFVNAVIKGRSAGGIVKLPRHIVRDHKVPVVLPDNKLELRHVNVVRADVEFAYIKDSLKSGERVALTNVGSLGTGQLVKVQGDETKPSSKQDTPAEERLAQAGDK